MAKEIDTYAIYPAPCRWKVLLLFGVTHFYSTFVRFKAKVL